MIGVSVWGPGGQFLAGAEGRGRFVSSWRGLLELRLCWPVLV